MKKLVFFMFCYTYLYLNNMLNIDFNNFVILYNFFIIENTPVRMKPSSMSVTLDRTVCLELSPNLFFTERETKP